MLPFANVPQIPSDLYNLGKTPLGRIRWGVLDVDVYTVTRVFVTRV